ncbi:MAG: sigma-54-dependent Fis family transcriptional regulator, partial [Deltaproteobacteria bacterium]|nr:sigma-54-dependent Fis family transcriptional regulator [Deltaproteobacteria bacterium]
MGTRSTKGRVLVVDDEVNARTALEELLRDEGYEVATAADAFKALGKVEAFAPHVVITDLNMPGMTGIELIKKLRTEESPPEVIVMTAAGRVSTAVEAMRAGAADYLQKPLDFDELTVTLGKLFEQHQLRREARILRARVRERFKPTNIIGDSEPMRRVFELVDQVAPSKATVLITGESGTGKELIANALHQRSPRANGPFIKVHCAALAETLLESELFGHEKGAFTGALARKEGRFELANGGTLFLDEIGEISPSIQVKLLRFLQEHELERVGGTETIKVDVRVISATNKDLEAEVAAGRFRQDLYFRLHVLPVKLPPLRERREDIPTLVAHFIHKLAAKTNPRVRAISDAALGRIMA